VQDAFRFRHACKEFDAARTIPADESIEGFQLEPAEKALRRVMTAERAGMQVIEELYDKI